jgi:Lrp/AsnC family transcriptional regulator, leucine-responsive regulatory protein
MIDQTDLEIINLLKENARIQWRDIGERVHLTGQAVSNRIQRLEKLGIIKGYSAIIDENLLGKHITAYVTVYMKTTEHALFQKFIKENDNIIEASRISGEGCYLLKVNTSTHEELTNILDAILEYGNYKVNMSIGKVK